MAITEEKLNKTELARALHISSSTLWRSIKKISKRQESITYIVVLNTQFIQLAESTFMRRKCKTG